MATKYDPILGEMREEDSSPYDKGYYATPTALTTALPVGEAGWFCNIGTTDTVWIWDADTSAWIDSKTKAAPTKAAIEAVLTGEIITHTHPATGGSDTVATLTTSQTWTVPAGVALLKDVYIFGGGGGGGGGSGTGGGAGGMVHLTNYIVTPADGIVCVIGAGGAGGTNAARIPYPGGNTSFGTFIGLGGGGGYAVPTTGVCLGLGGCGAGMCVTDGVGNNVGIQGRNGGYATANASGAGGGGGITGNGKNGIAGVGGNGGDGIYLGDIVGTGGSNAGWFSGGGGGGSYGAKAGGSGGRGGGANGGSGSGTTGSAATANTGGGGGGAGGDPSYTGNGGAGGSGIIIIRY